MSILDPKDKHELKSLLPPTEEQDSDYQDSDSATESEAPKPINLQKRDYDLDPVRFGDWEINGRCIDF